MEVIKLYVERWLENNTNAPFKNEYSDSVFFKPEWGKRILNTLFNQPQHLNDLISDIIDNDKHLGYGPTFLLRIVDNLCEIICAENPKQPLEIILYFRDNLIQKYFEQISSEKTSNNQAQNLTNYWEIETVSPSAPDIHTILEEILNLLLKITSSDQIYLFLADFPYQSYNPFMALGNLSPTQKKTFFEAVVRPDTDILLSSLIKSRKTIEISKGEIETQYPAYIYQTLLINQALAIPIKIEDRILGYILLNKEYSPPPPSFLKETINTAESVTSAMALALENARLYEITNQRLAESQSINQINLAMLQSFQRNEVLDIICSHAISLTQGIGSTVHLLDNSKQILSRASHAGFLIHKAEIIPVEDSFLKSALQNLDPILINKSSIDQRLPDGSKFSVLAIPLSIHHQVVGVLDITKKRNKFTPDDIRIIKIFADQASIAIEHANLYQQAGLSAKLEERQKMARNLHDSVNQNLYAVLLYSRTIKKLITANNNEKAIEILDQLKMTTKEALNDLRIFIHELRPSILEDEGLVLAIQRRLESVEEKLGFTIHFQFPDQMPHMPIDLQEGFYRITQEALNNIVKHAKADIIFVTLSLKNSTLSLKIRDNGIGYDQSIKHGYGLKSMQERANLINGKLRLQSQLYVGTTVKIEVKI